MNHMLVAVTDVYSYTGTLTKTLHDFWCSCGMKFRELEGKAVAAHIAASRQ